MSKKNTKKNRNKIIPVKKKACSGCGYMVARLNSDKCTICQTGAR